MNQPAEKHPLFLAALKEVVSQYPKYFYITGELSEIDSMWDLQPQFSMLEHLLLEDSNTQQFIGAVWSFFKPISIQGASFADSIRTLEPWQRNLLA